MLAEDVVVDSWASIVQGLEVEAFEVDMADMLEHTEHTEVGSQVGGTCRVVGEHTIVEAVLVEIVVEDIFAELVEVGDLFAGDTLVVDMLEGNIAELALVEAGVVVESEDVQAAVELVHTSLEVAFDKVKL